MAGDSFIYDFGNFQNEVYRKQLEQNMQPTSHERTEEVINPLKAKIEQLEQDLAARDFDLAKLKVTYQRACDTIKSFLKKVLEARNENKQLADELNNERKTVEELRQQVLTLQNPSEHEDLKVLKTPNNFFF